MESTEWKLPMGIRLRLPASFIVDQNPDGFRISTSESGMTRIPREVLIKIVSTASQPGGNWPTTRKIKQRLIYYKIEKQEGGSAGTAYILTAWEALAQGFLLAEQYTQVDGIGSPDFTMLWHVLEGVLPGDS